MSVQITLDSTASQTLQVVSERTGKSQEELIREALNLLAVQYASQARTAKMRQANGIWRDRTDLPDWEALRRELDRLE